MDQALTTGSNCPRTARRPGEGRDPYRRHLSAAHDGRRPSQELYPGTMGPGLRRDDRTGRVWFCQTARCVDDREHSKAFSRRHPPEFCSPRHPLWKQRAQERPGGRMHPGRPRKTVARKARSPQVQAGSARPSLRSGFTAYTWSPRWTGVCHRRLAWPLEPLPDLALLGSARTTRFRRPPPCRSSDSTSASTASPHHVSWRRVTPLMPARTGSTYTPNPNFWKQEYFCQQGLTGFLQTPAGPCGGIRFHTWIFSNKRRHDPYAPPLVSRA